MCYGGDRWRGGGGEVTESTNHKSEEKAKAELKRGPSAYQRPKDLPLGQTGSLRLPFPWFVVFVLSRAGHGANI